jgi:inhibitor of cysteine peptidase
VLLAFGMGLVVLVEYSAMAGDAKTITVSEKDSGTKVKLAKGDTLVVRLEVQGGTGFTWKIAKNDDAVLKSQGKPEVERPEKPKPGGKVTHIYRFTAEKAGAAELEMHYARPFEKDKAPAKTFKLTLEAP